MLRTPLNKAYLKRTIRPLYGWTQATPKSAFLDPAWDRSTPIFPGMAMQICVDAGGSELYTLAGNARAITGGGAQGLSGLYIGGDGIDEVLEQGINAIAVWVLGPDAEFEVLAPAFVSGAGGFAGTEPAGTLVHFNKTAAAAADRGKLVPAGATNADTRPVAKLLKIVDTTKIIIGGLQGTVN